MNTLASPNVEFDTPISNAPESSEKPVTSLNEYVTGTSQAKILWCTSAGLKEKEEKKVPRKTFKELMQPRLHKYLNMFKK